MEKGSYYLHRDSKTGEILYLQYDKIKGYPITPKVKLEDSIVVNKIIFVNPTLSEKLIQKKVEIKIRHLLQKLEELDNDEDGGNEGDIQYTLMEAERLKLNIINTYVKYLGNTYASFSIQKIQVIINKLRLKLYNKLNEKRLYERYYQGFNPNDLYYLDEEEREEKKGRGR